MFEDMRKEHTGLWVGFWLPRPIAEKLAIEGGEKPEDMHLTLAYVPGAGSMDDDNKQKVLDALSDFARRYNPIAGVVGGLGRFFASGTSGGKDVIYSSFDAPELPGFRQDLVRCLEAVGYPPSKAHGYTPHITLAYVDSDMDVVFAHGESVNVTFPWLHVKFGEATSHTFMLLGLGARDILKFEDLVKRADNYVANEEPYKSFIEERSGFLSGVRWTLKKLKKLGLLNFRS